MRRRVEQLLPVLVLVGFIGAAIVLNLLLSSAQQRGVDALEDSVASEVSAIAGSQDQRFVNTFSGTAGLAGSGQDPYELTVGSEGDLAKLDEILQLIPNARSGFYVVDDEWVVTQGVQMLDPASIGQPMEWPGLDELVGQPTFAQGVGGVLPVSEGLTTEEPVIALVIPILDTTTGVLRGAFVFESVVAVDSDFNKEIGQLQRGDTGEYLFYDDRGGVVAANDPSLLGRPLDDERLVSGELGTHRYDGDLVVVDEVPAAGWRVAFRQDIDEFEDPLVAPLENAGRILVLGILAGGFFFTFALYRRLRASRAEQERLRLLSEAQQELISIVSHELRTPVAGVLGFLETTLDHWEGMDDAERRSAVGRALANARRLQAMTRDVLDTQNVESGRLVHVLQPLDLGAEVTAAVEAARAVAPDRTFALDVPDREVIVEGDADRLHQVLANLLDNAQKSSPAVEPIEVELAVRDGHAEVAVRDHGAGIAEESLERIFDKFVRERGDTVSGTGLGLYISRQILEAHGGRIWAESEPGAGATFHVSLPVASRPSEGHVDHPPTEPPAPDPNG
jgi:signal transduction histidine kinase